MGSHGSAAPAGRIGRTAVVAGVLVGALLIGVAGGAALRSAGRPTASPGASASGSVSASPGPSASQPAGGTSPTPGSPQPGVTSPVPSARPVTFPPAVEGRVGARYWTVYLSVTRSFDDPRDAEAGRQARAAGYGDLVIREGGINCDDGAREGLTRAGVQLDPKRDYATVKLFFLTRQQATQFVDAFRPGVVGTVLVTFACLD